MHNFIETPICMGKERLKDPKHPTQKPIRVLQKVVKIASNKGDIVLDPFMGVGSVGVAALRLGRRFLGIEIEEKYYKAAEKRLEEEAKQKKMF
jgi:site-specific DNA-methyltransferase (adenine-specific)/modification methylase